MREDLRQKEKAQRPEIEPERSRTRLHESFMKCGDFINVETFAKIEKLIVMTKGLTDATRIDNWLMSFPNFSAATTF